MEVIDSLIDGLNEQRREDCMRAWSVHVLDVARLHPPAAHATHPTTKRHTKCIFCVLFNIVLPQLFEMNRMRRS